MNLLTTAQLSRMRTMQDEAMPDMCTISHYTSVSDGAGGLTDTWSDVLIKSKCRLSVVNRRQAREDSVTNAAQLATDWMITLPVGTQVGERDRITVTTINNRLFEVIKPQIHSWETALRVPVTEIT